MFNKLIADDATLASYANGFRTTPEMFKRKYQRSVTMEDHITSMLGYPLL